MKVWKIQQHSSGLFSTGGINPSFNKEGKIWSRRQDLEAHLAQFISSDGRHLLSGINGYPQDCTVIEYDLEKKNWTGTIHLLALIADKRYRKINDNHQAG